MPSYRVRFSANLDMAVDIDAESEDKAMELAGELADGYCQTVCGDQYVSAYASMDGVGAYEVEKVK